MTTDQWRALFVQMTIDGGAPPLTPENASYYSMKIWDISRENNVSLSECQRIANEICIEGGWACWYLFLPTNRWIGDPGLVGPFSTKEDAYEHLQWQGSFGSFNTGVTSAFGAEVIRPHQFEERHHKALNENFFSPKRAEEEIAKLLDEWDKKAQQQEQKEAHLRSLVAKL